MGRNMRREFPKPVKREALRRAAGNCEECGALHGVKFHFDHAIADGLGGEPTLENCAVLCHVCHNDKTRNHDVPRIAKMKRVRDLHQGIRKTSRFPGSKSSRFKKKINGEVVLR